MVSAVLPDGDRHHQGIGVGVCNRHQDFGDAHDLGSGRRPSVQIDGRLPTAGDLDVPPRNPAPSGAHGLHYRLLARETRSQPTGRFGEPECVLALVDRETPLGEPRVALKHPSDPLDVGQVDAKTEDSHRPVSYAVPTR